jgi:signal transduction histidine kinase
MPELPRDATARPLPPDLDRLLHDLRGPLNSAVMYGEVLRRVAKGDQPLEQNLTAILQQLERLGRMLPAAFGVLALELGATAAVPLRRLVEGAAAAPGLRSVTLEAGEWPDVVGDERLLGLAVTHLLRNAVEATADAGQARPPYVSVCRDAEGRVELRVRDSGGGLPTTNPKVLLRLLHSRKSAERGVGLISVERIARLHGGALRFESSREGTLVALALPIAH